MLISKTITMLICLQLLLSAQTVKPQTILIKNVRLLDFDSADTTMAVQDILIRDGMIVQTGAVEAKSLINENIKTIDADGKFAMPGLIDGFAAINNQAYANAYLYSGVTSIIAVSGGRRGVFFPDARPSPHLYQLKEIGDKPLTDTDIRTTIKRYAREGISVLLLMYRLKPDQVSLAVRLAKKYNLVTIGELGFTSYPQGMASGIQAFVHSTRYSLALAPDSMAAAVAREPFSNDLHSPKWRYYLYLSRIALTDKKLQNYARLLGESESYIMPTLSLFYLDLPGHRNPWKEPVADMLDPADINSPADRQNGNHNYSEEMQRAYTTVGSHILEIEQVYHRQGAHYLAGSATDVWGTMPGISLLTELELLQRIGLTKREALAAASVNYHHAFGWNIGRIVPGYRADILLLTANPLHDPSALDKIETVILGGEIIDRQKLLEN